MKVSLNIIKQLINFELPPVDELVARVNQQLGGVEEVIDLSAKYGGARIARGVECAKHPDADRLGGYGAQISLLNTGNGFGGECHLDAPMVAAALSTETVAPPRTSSVDRCWAPARAACSA